MRKNETINAAADNGNKTRAMDCLMAKLYNLRYEKPLSLARISSLDGIFFSLSDLGQ